MLLENAVLYWTPDTELYERKRHKGHIIAAEWGKGARLRMFPKVVGACMLNWSEADGYRRRQLLVSYVRQILEDNVSEERVFIALQSVDDINPLQILVEAKDRG